MEANASHITLRQAPTLPQLPVVDRSTMLAFEKPIKRINEGRDVDRFLMSHAYHDLMVFILQLNRALCPRHQSGATLPRCYTLAKAGSTPNTPSVQALLALLTNIEGLISLAPPDHGERRFGNVSFRRWYALLEARIDTLLDIGCLEKMLAIDAGAAKKEVEAYLLGAFGSARRLDYGTGHELSFAAFLGCLWKLGFFQDGKQGGEIERHIVLYVFQSYLDVVRKLIKTYTLEPAGSHGVWGLDDHSFLPYVFGSAQLTRPIDDAEPMPVDGSVKGAPSPGDVTKEAVVGDYRATNMYFSAIGFINDVKKGPFWEHSPMLFDISGVRDGWGKINKGMLKMFDAEVLSKFPVVQHFPFGSLFSWEQDLYATLPAQSMHMANQPMMTTQTLQTPSVTHAALGASAIARVPGRRLASSPAGFRCG